MKKIFSVLLSLLIIGGFAAFSINIPSTHDPLVTLSYINNKFIPKITEIATKTLSELFPINQYLKDLSNKELTLANIISKNINPSSYIKDDTITTSSQFTISSGSAIANKTMLNLSTGQETPYHTPLEKNIIYLPVSQTNITITSSTANLDIFGAKYTPKYTKYAQSLEELGLFKGTTIGYELSRPATRSESLTMLIRILGEESYALSSTKKHPFTDIPSWNDPYVRYAYEKKYTKGQSKTIFGSNNNTNPQEYITFILRSLGYNDDKGDFKFETSLNKALEIGLINSQYHKTLQNPKNFNRDDIVYISYLALSQNLNNSTQTLADKLIDAKIFTKDKYISISKKNY